ncbi:hypothetical protein GCM10009678_85910 [Actinomadura kijaniata]|uniref:Uncharacterized protein n=1 Tax=Actinomadura namibiensis TaxID=182080 RepID=A0A7W3LJW4_ACTNM|nr:hypothetical protein [Actinomadura namibiensis]MBA8949425.1 hypothetical protein [Actinomadura namibiensis]
MADRANYVIVRDGTWSLHESRRGAPRLEGDLLEGPEAATREFGGFRRGEGWLGDGLAAAAALVDHDRRRLLYYSTEIDDYAWRAAVRETLRRVWSGWDVRWAFDGQGDLAAYVGCDRAVVRDGSSPSPLWASHGTADFVGCLVTVADTGGTRAYALDTPFSDLLARGVDLVGALPEGARVTECLSLPESGIHFDMAGRSAGFWTVQPVRGADERARAHRPGWEWAMWNDRYGEQIVRSGLELPEPDMAGAYEELRRRTRAGSPALAVIDVLGSGARG